ncbi:MAG: hypothetical protein RR307_03530 [Clostridia bacterium]
MSLYKYMEEIPVTSNCEMTYENMAFDGRCYYFLLCGKNKIIKTDKNFIYINSFETKNDYNCITYDYKERCFWAATKKFCNKVFKLDCKLKEIDCLAICGYVETVGAITGISFNCCANSLFIAYAAGIVELKKDGNTTIKYQACCEKIIGVLSVCPGYVINVIKDNNQYIHIINCDNELILSYCLKTCNTLKNIIFNPCHKERDYYTFDCLTVKKNSYSYIIRVIIEPHCVDLSVCKCNYTICNNSCNGKSVKKTGACVDVIESVALIETALSHILNAEGEKLQKVLASTDDISQILCVNKEINKTLINATNLEHTLYAKLSAAIECCDDNICDNCNDTNFSELDDCITDAINSKL